MSNNEKPEGEVKKECPFNGKWCGDWCPLYSLVRQNMGGVMRQAGMCAFVATNVILSEINKKGNNEQQIVLPRNIKGN